MFIRRTTYKMGPGFDTAEGQREFENALRKTLRPEDIEGLINTTHIPNDDGTWAVVAVWRGKHFADAQTGRIRAAWNQFSSQLEGPPRIETSSTEFHDTW